MLILACMHAEARGKPTKISIDIGKAIKEAIEPTKA